MGLLNNLDLISVAMAIAGIAILGFSVFFNNRHSATNRNFLYLSWAIIFWSLFTYLFHYSKDPEYYLFLIRISLFFAVLFAFYLFRLAYVFPGDTIKLPSWYRILVLPAVIVVLILTLTPFALQKAVANPSGENIVNINGPGMVLFGIVAGGLDIVAISLFLKKMLSSKGVERRQALFVLIGVGTMIGLILAFSFILPAFFKITNFTSLGAVFVFPFVAFTAYAIYRHHLLNVKVFTTAAVAFLFTIVGIFEIIISKDINVLVFRSAVFLLTLVFSILLVRSVFKEVEQKEELEEKNIQLDELGRSRLKLLSIAAHDIKNPLTIIRDYAGMILDGTYKDEKAKEKLGSIKEESDGLMGLLITLLDYRQIVEGKLVCNLEPMDFGALVSEVVKKYTPEAERHKLELTLSLPAKKIMVNGDAPKLKQEVLQNLLSNAIKYTPAGFIKVFLEEKNNAVVLSVVDSGYGMSPELLSHLFEEFIREEKIEKQIRGTGLGLSIAKKIIEAHGGKIWAESAGENKGSTFYVSVPEVK